MSFHSRLQDACSSGDSMVCLGLDPVLERLPPHLGKDVEAILEFNMAIVDATRDVVAAYKPNSAFYEQYGIVGMRILEQTIGYIHSRAPELLVILDAKRADIGNTSGAYARAAFDVMASDAITLAPYMGGDSLQPFLDHAEKGCFILCRTSNPGGSDLQGLSVNGVPLYEVVARKALEWNTNDNVGLVVGATMPGELARIREIVGPDMPLLVPGVGAQGGDPVEVVKLGRGGGSNNLLVNSSRGILYADGSRDFAAGARAAAIRLRDELNTPI